MVEGSRKTSRSAASAARQKTAVVMSGTQVEEEEDEEEGADGDEDEGEEDEDEEEDSGITRCVCGKESESSVDWVLWGVRGRELTTVMIACRSRRSRLWVDD